MKVIRPITIDDSVLVSSTVPETDYTAWSAATNYSIGAYVIRTTTHRIYKSLASGVDAGLPESTPTRWVDVGATNRWRMLDSEVGSQTTASTSLSVVLLPGYCNALALLEVDALSITLTIRSSPGGTITYSETRSLDPTVLTSWYAYFYTDPVPRSEVVFTGLDVGAGYTVEVTLSGTTVACGSLAIGSAFDLGGTEFGANLGIIDYSKKSTNEFGVTKITERAFAKRLSARMVFDRAQTSAVFRTLSSLRATPCVYVTSEASDYESLTVYGYWRDFRIDVAYPTMHYCSLEVEGLI